MASVAVKSNQAPSAVGAPVVTNLWVGIDVSKESVDVHILPLGVARRFALEATDTPANTPVDPRAGDTPVADVLALPVGPLRLASFIREQAELARAAGQGLCPLPQILCVIEPSGGYERDWIDGLSLRDIPVAMVPANRVRAHARAAGYLAKTDSIDARILAEYGRVHHPRPLPPADPARLELRALVERREQLVVQCTAEKLRLEKATTKFARASIQRVLDFLAQETEAIETQIEGLYLHSPRLRAIHDLLLSAPGVGKCTAATLLAHLPELGTVTPRQIAALVGVAPVNRDSGTMRGKRTILGGRGTVRRALYLAAFCGLRCKRDHPAKLLYQRLRAAGKPYKSALIAAARKLLVLLNAMVRDNTPFNYDKAARSHDQPPA